MLAVPLFGERLPARGWAGMALGVAGVALVLAPKLAAPATAHGAAGALGLHGAGGRGCRSPRSRPARYTRRAPWHGPTCAPRWRSRTAGAALVAAAFALALGETHWQPAPTLWLGLAWGIAMLSGGAIVLFVWLLRHGGAARATSLMFLAPPLAALQGYWLFGETLGALQLAGFAVALAGVALARWVALNGATPWPACPQRQPRDRAGLARFALMMRV